MSDIHTYCTSLNVHYNKGYIYDEICKFDNIAQKTCIFKNMNTYIHHFVDHVKDNILKHYANLHSVTVDIKLFDHQNAMHTFLMSIYHKLMDENGSKHSFDEDKYTIMMYVTHENKIVFASVIKTMEEVSNEVEFRPFLDFGISSFCY